MSRNTSIINKPHILQEEVLSRTKANTGSFDSHRGNRNLMASSLYPALRPGEQISNNQMHGILGNKRQQTTNIVCTATTTVQSFLSSPTTAAAVTSVGGFSQPSATKLDFLSMKHESKHQCDNTVPSVSQSLQSHNGGLYTPVNGQGVSLMAQHSIETCSSGVVMSESLCNGSTVPCVTMNVEPMSSSVDTLTSSVDFSIPTSSDHVMQEFTPLNLVSSLPTQPDESSMDVPQLNEMDNIISDTILESLISHGEMTSLPDLSPIINFTSAAPTTTLESFFSLSHGVDVNCSEMSVTHDLHLPSSMSAKVYSSQSNYQSDSCVANSN